MEQVLASLVSLAAPTPAPSDGVLSTARASIVLRLHASPERAFPLFDPVNESLWAPDWRPALLGDGRVAPGLVFTTQDEHGRAAWLLDTYDATRRVLRYVTVRATTLTTIDISIVPAAGNASTATVTYTRTALDARGNENVAAFAHHFPNEGPHWENAINAVLDDPQKAVGANPL